MTQENGYWHPEHGYSEFVAPPTPEDIAALPEGTVEVPLKPGADYEWDPQAEEWQHTPPPPPTPEERRALMRPITARQLRLTLRREAGITPAMVEGIIAAIEDEGVREDALIEWEYASHYERLHPLILALAPALELTDEAVDALWEQALVA